MYILPQLKIKLKKKVATRKRKTRVVNMEPDKAACNFISRAVWVQNQRHLSLMGLFAKTMNIKHLLRLFKVLLDRTDPPEQVLDVTEQF